MTPGLVLILATVVAAVALVLWLALTRVRLAEPGCGACGYPVRGLEALECPECGGDLRVVGIATPRMRSGAPFLAMAVLWTVAILLGAPLAVRVGGRAVVQTHVHQSRTIFIQQPVNLTLTASGYTVIPGSTTGTLRRPDQMTLELQGTPPRLAIDYRSGGYVHLGGSPISGPSYSQDVLVRWLIAAAPASAGLDPATAAQLGPYLQQLIDEMGTNAGGGFTRVDQPSLELVAHPRSSFSREHVPPGYYFATAAAWLGVWLIGLAAIARRTRASLRMVAAFVAAVVIIAALAMLLQVRW